jgi:hypothetical protein
VVVAWVVLQGLSWWQQRRQPIAPGQQPAMAERDAA